MKEALETFVTFLKSPKPLKQVKYKYLLIRDFAALLILYVSFTILLLSVFGLLLHFDLIREYKGIDLLKEFGVLGTLFLACIVAPLLEETIFRCHLKDLNGAIYFIFLSLGALTVSQVNGIRIQLAIIGTALVLAVLVIEFLKKKSRFYATKFWIKIYPYLFYYTAIIFGLVHLSNYKDLTVTDPSFVFYIGSQAFGGLGLGYLRIKYGLIYSMLFHALFNLLMVSLVILFS
ncbi:MAG: CPBP family glutamic-type intramembrane protease [Pedobacter sp.]|uniref:CPBP family glutamic-type intramembrane protease n=1 Tax=Pedobacter sp. TaxID=1411316 RepID=UPI00280717DA|nr:CPBP family glutamic-type intramembrane protease [Pedobacter sp.]MDQ8006540.1 CPBP family glutamic-type intramembrane protease [Pedobacter sp.]